MKTHSISDHNILSKTRSDPPLTKVYVDPPLTKVYVDPPLTKVEMMLRIGRVSLNQLDKSCHLGDGVTGCQLM